ncbi:MAG: excinuclease ABC C subunit domain-containing protein [Candidatus Roizmanbacteria bacterium GW2011_GWC2_37_13]|uniref:Excinuclease ABC C subunit domain-containing protein n=1 Tax=Candidatus Roizmanbacteria bacterium GW2011_GWC2_37_13 TaxID=1618486 RepID=A0A0G0G8B0_9BACT|nr:MAG: excinuclease ABC C subunit domain-containing protein [Candidatus Roizmanbacteria bacterium GW2011_GWC1_37_12]KKQ26227.1 MAG: excinuclease ABC C subunit domain-containing protein [Candidatus Roizmanbacteria bacterium GW2011_GWC2_37_13]
MYYTYIIELKNKAKYIGFSSDLKNRIKDHIIGSVSQTKNFRPIKLIFYAAFENKLRALKFEQYLKTPSGFAFRNKRLI